MDMSLYAVIMAKMKPLIESVRGYFIKSVDFKIDEGGGLQYNVQLNTPATIQEDREQ